MDQRAALLRTLRREHGLTQQQLSERAGVSVRTLRALERDEVREPHLATLESLATALALPRGERARLLRTWAQVPMAPFERLFARTGVTDDEQVSRFLAEEYGKDIRYTHVSSRARISASRRMVECRYHAVILALEDGVRGTCLINAADPLVLPRVQLSDVHGCTVAGRREVPTLGLVIFGLQFARPLQEGESAVIDYTVLEPDDAGEPSHRVLRGSRRGMASLAVSVEFEAPPARLWQVTATAGREEVTGAVSRERAPLVQLALKDVPPGSYGFAWDWEEPGT